jgi:hypothetical protein
MGKREMVAGMKRNATIVVPITVIVASEIIQFQRLWRQTYGVSDN